MHTPTLLRPFPTPPRTTLLHSKFLLFQLFQISAHISYLLLILENGFVDGALGFDGLFSGEVGFFVVGGWDLDEDLLAVL